MEGQDALRIPFLVSSTSENKDDGNPIPKDRKRGQKLPQTWQLYFFLLQ